MNLFCLDWRAFTSRKLSNTTDKAVTVTVAPSSQEIRILNTEKSFLLVKYKYNVLKISVWAFGIHLNESSLSIIFFLE